MLFIYVVRVQEISNLCSVVIERNRGGARLLFDRYVIIANLNRPDYIHYWCWHF